MVRSCCAFASKKYKIQVRNCKRSKRSLPLSSSDSPWELSDVTSTEVDVRRRRRIGYSREPASCFFVNGGVQLVYDTHFRESSADHQIRPPPPSLLVFRRCAGLTIDRGEGGIGSSRSRVTSA